MERPRSIAFDTRAAVTRSLLGWGVVAGPFYLLVGVVHALLKPGFDFSRHPLSLLMLTDTGWIHRANLILTGLMVIAAAVGLGRAAMPGTRARVLTVLVAVFGVGMIGSGIFPPDPLAGFPPGAEATASVSGILHLLLGAIGFLCLGAAAIVFSRWARARGAGIAATLSLIAGIVVILGFVGGGALGALPIGVVALWAAVVAGFAWLLGACLFAYRTVPHPNGTGR
ncbi:DUF998 domain-containing protein [Naasia sp. SYSU D00948]|uniref:DUF998 domain-containing protein n=1 Tax=Naasia sp. SYSU D00948 TaxID=2817379 RepID=UPI001B30E490|nr:DUF998 domain-containing protein [Naasia sp. SYSU D00948]